VAAGLASVLVGVLLALLPAPPASAHRTNISISQVRVEGAAVGYRLVVSAHDLAVAVGIETDLVTPLPRDAFAAREREVASYIAERLRISSEDRECRSPAPVIGYARLPQEVVFDLDFRCPSPVATLVIDYNVFFEIDERHRALGAIHTTAGTQEFLLDATLKRIALPIRGTAPPTPWIERASRFVVLGIEHILSGIDHILFVLALLLVASRFLNLVKVVTAFTIAHSITLALAWHGLVDLPSRLLESAIALSIVYVAFDNLYGNLHAHRWIVAFVFELVHGLGFYAVLSELALASEDALTTLFAFNLGVEMGQLAILSVVFPLLLVSFRRNWYGRAMKGASAAIAMIASFWFIQRAFLG
jgi:hypothetical protein